AVGPRDLGELLRRDGAVVGFLRLVGHGVLRVSLRSEGGARMKAWLASRSCTRTNLTSPTRRAGSSASASMLRVGSRTSRGSWPPIHRWRAPSLPLQAASTAGAR